MALMPEALFPPRFEQFPPSQLFRFIDVNLRPLAIGPPRLSKSFCIANSGRRPMILWKTLPEDRKSAAGMEVVSDKQHRLRRGIHLGKTAANIGRLLDGRVIRDRAYTDLRPLISRRLGHEVRRILRVGASVD